jgi:Ca2+-binding RTX toxin-like protein
MPIDILGNEIFTQTLTGSGSSETLNITEEDGVGTISVLCTSSTAGTITGGATIDGKASEAVSIAENNSVTISATSGKTLGTLTITAPDGCTLIVVANQG